mgnify:CR=1 FL=1
MQGTIIFGLIFAILIAIFAIQNASIVALNILMWEFEISLAVVVLGSIIFGALVIGIFSYFKQFQLKRRNKNLKLEIQSLKEERDKLILSFCYLSIKDLVISSTCEWSTVLKDVREISP